MTREDLMSQLIERGFRAGSTRATTWTCAVAMERAGMTLVVLIRRNGIDILQTRRPLADIIEGGYLRVQRQYEGSAFASYNYSGSGESIHRRVLEVAHRFATGQDIDEFLLQNIGEGPKQRRTRWRAEHGDNLYEAADGEGDSMYLCDGMWVDREGTLREG